MKEIVQVHNKNSYISFWLMSNFDSAVAEPVSGAGMVD